MDCYSAHEAIRFNPQKSRNHTSIRIFFVAILLVGLSMFGFATIPKQAHADGAPTITQHLGINAATYHQFLQAHSADSTYLGTSYNGLYHDGANGFDGWLHPAGEGMNCEGFVDNVLKNCGASAPVAVSPGGEGWTMIVRNHGLLHHDFSSKEDMLNSGVLSYGDIIYMYDGYSDRGLSDDHHIGIFIGSHSHDDKMWHSSSDVGNSYGNIPAQNQISPIIPKSENCHFWRVIKVDQTGSIDLQKYSSNKSISKDNKCYSLQGTTYTIYCDSGLHNVAGVLATDSNGYARVDSLSPGTYFVKETTAGRGYTIDDTTYQVHVSAGNTARVNSDSVSDAPQNNPVNAVLAKVDAQSNKGAPQGSGKLANAQYTIKYYDNYYDENNLPADATRTWVLKTGTDGKVLLDDSHFVSGNNFYYSQDGHTPTLPLGTVTIQETLAPEGYTIDSTLHVRQITSDGSAESVHTFKAPTSPEKIKRGDIEFVKAADDSTHRMAHVPFKITSVTTGESHVVVTDENGMFSSKNDYNAHTSNTNVNDWALTAKGDIDASKLQSSAGTWFGGYKSSDDGVKPEDTTGAFPYDTYRIEELPATSNSGYVLPEPSTFKVTRDNFTIGLGTIDNLTPDLNTVASDASDGDHNLNASAEATINDAVEYRNVVPGKAYRLTSEIHDAKTGDILSFDGHDMRKESKFTPSDKDGVENIGFTIDTSNFAGKTLVIYEVLSDDRGNILCAHKDKDDTNQQITIVPPNMKTTASDAADGNHTVAAAYEMTIKDEVAYHNLAVGTPYTLTSEIHDAETGDIATVNGEKLVKKTSFTPENANAVEHVSFTFDTSLFVGKTLVFYETITDEKGNVILAHADKDDIDQQFSIDKPSLQTKASDTADGDNIIAADPQSSITDTVEYHGLMPEKEYKICGTLHQKVTNKDGEIIDEIVNDKEGNPVTAETTFTPKEAHGTTSVTFTFDASSLAQDAHVVVFEDLYSRDIHIAAHSDIDDTSQTVTVQKPQVYTNARDAQDDDQIATADSKTTITDTVNYQGVVPHKEYTLVGILMDRDTGLPIIQNEQPQEQGGEPATNTLDESSWEQLCSDFNDLFADTQSDSSKAENTNKQLMKNNADEEGSDQVTSNDHEEHPDSSDAASDHSEDGENQPADNQIDYAFKKLNPERLKDFKATHGETIRSLITSQGLITPEKSEGSASQTFNFDSSNMAGTDGNLRNVVAIEFLAQGDLTDENADSDLTKDSAPFVAAAETNLQNDDQTVKISPSSIKTTATNKVDGTHELNPESNVTISDHVEYHNLIPGKEYLLHATLMDKRTQTPLVIDDQTVEADLRFTPNEPDGSIDIDLGNIDASSLANSDLVVFEHLSKDDAPVAVHQDINDEKQTVHVKELPQTPESTESSDSPLGTYGKTGVNIFGLAILAVLLGAAGIGFIAYSRHRS